MDYFLIPAQRSLQKEVMKGKCRTFYSFVCTAWSLYWITADYMYESTKNRVAPSCISEALT